MAKGSTGSSGSGKKRNSTTRASRRVVTPFTSNPSSSNFTPF